MVTDLKQDRYMMLYACAIAAHGIRDGEVTMHTSPMLCFAASEDEAIGKAVRAGAEVYPSKLCLVSVTPLPYDMAQRVAYRVHNGEYGVEIGREPEND